jgi:Putative transposase
MLTLRRFLMHLLPQGFHRIRYYGLLTGQTRANNITRIRELLAVPLILPRVAADL